MGKELEALGAYILAQETKKARKEGMLYFGALILRLIDDDFKNSTETKRRYKKLIIEEMERLNE